MKKTQQLISNSIRRTVRRGRFALIGPILIAGLALSATQWHKAQNAKAAAAFATITVDLGLDIADANDGKCSLREAIIAANTNAASGPVAGECPAGTAGMDTIVFALGSSPTIAVNGALPAIFETLTIDGATGGATRVVLDGANGTPFESALVIAAGGCVIKSLVIKRFDGQGIELQGPGGNTVENCRIGTDANGINPEQNRFSGINISSPNNTIRGNLISGNKFAGIDVCCATGNLIVGNCIGTNAAGTAAIPNGLNGSGRGITMGFGGGATIGGTNAADRNVISGNSGAGIYLDGNTSGGVAAMILGNYIGVTKDGMGALGNDGNGILLNSATNLVIGGTANGSGNVISANTGSGITIFDSAAANQIKGNLIGRNYNNTANLGNQSQGINLFNASNTVIGGSAAARNVIAGNTGAGVLVGETITARGNSVLFNSIFDNGQLGIELTDFLTNGVTINDTGDGDTGANNLQNFPDLTSAASTGGSITITGSLNSEAGKIYRIQFFANDLCDPSGNGEGKTYLGETSVTTDGSGDATINTTLAVAVAAGKFITATATAPDGNTSEFSACKQVMGNTNAPPTIIAAAPPPRQAGSPATNATIATVSDAETPAGNLMVTATTVPPGITINNIINTGGVITADLAAACNAATGGQTVVLTVADAQGSATANLLVTVTANTPPTLSYEDQTVALGSSGLIVNPATGPSDNGSIASISLQNVSPKKNAPTATVDNETGKVLLTDITSPGKFTVNIQARDNCGANRTANFKVTVTSSALAIAARAVVNDFDGDGTSDPVSWNAEDGSWRILRSSDGELQIEQWGAAGDRAVPADYDGDGKADLAVWRAADGLWLIKGSSDGEAISRQWGLGTDTPVAADYDGDGKADIAVWRGSVGAWLILRSSDNQVETAAWGLASAPYFDVPVAADYDGDGKTDIAIFRRANGRWLIKQSSDGSVVEKQWGLATDTPVPADYDGDGKADIAVWRGAEGRWHIARSSDPKALAVIVGTMSPGDVPAPGDYDGDSQADLAIWRSGENAWFVKCSRDGQTMRKTMAER